MAIKSYRVSELDAGRLGEALSTWFEAQDYETQVLDTPGGVTVQARSMGSWVEKNAVALQVRVIQQSDQLNVEVGTSKWTMQAVSGVAAAIVFWPLLALPAFAAYKQKQIIDETWRWIDQYVASDGSVGVADDLFAPVPEQPQAQATAPLRACPSCGEPIGASNKFCANCGTKLLTACPECGAAIELGAKFCEHCGADVAAQ